MFYKKLSDLPYENQTPYLKRIYNTSTYIKFDEILFKLININKIPLIKYNQVNSENIYRLFTDNQYYKW